MFCLSCSDPLSKDDVLHFFFDVLLKSQLFGSDTKTRLYSFDPLKPHFIQFTGVYINVLISAQKHRLWVLVRADSLRQF